MTLIQKLISVYEEIDHIQKSGHNKNQNYDFVRATDMVRAVRKAFLKLGVYAEVNLVNERQYTIAREKAPNAPFNAVDVRCTIVFHDLESNETITSSGLGTGADTGDKAIYKAQTGATKYAMRNAFLVPDEADPEADERIDRGNYQSDEMPDFQDNRRGAPASRPANRDTAIESPKAQAAETQPLSGALPADSLSAATASAPAGREPGDESENELPTEEQMTGFRARFTKLADDLSSKGKLTASAGIKLNRKLLVFLMSVERVDDAKNLTVGQWEDFFVRAEDLAARENGLVNLTKLVNKANGIEDTKKKK